MLSLGIGLGITHGSWAGAGLLDTAAIDAKFDDGVYRGPSASTYETLFGTISGGATTNGTQVNSSGVKVWRAHNLIKYSEDMSTWGTSGVTISGDTATATATAGNHWFYLNQGGSIPSGIKYTTACNMTRTNHDFICLNFFITTGHYVSVVFDLSDGTIGESAVGSGETLLASRINQESDGSFTCEIDATTNSTGIGWGPLLCFAEVKTGNTFSSLGVPQFTAAGTESVVMNHVAVFRSDLGGMAPNPYTGDSYVKTEATTLYLPRHNHHVWDGAQWVDEGVLVEPDASTNLLLNTETLATQNVTTTAVPNTLHFTGTGTVTLTGTSTAGPLVGTGTGEDNRVSLTFTPTAGTLTLTVSGTVSDAMLEESETVSSYVPSGASQATRAADEPLTIVAANLGLGGVMPDAVSIAIEGTITSSDDNADPQSEILLWNADASNYIRQIHYTTAGTGEVYAAQNAAATIDTVVSAASVYAAGQNIDFSLASRHGATFINLAHEGTLLTENATPTALADLSGADIVLATSGSYTLKRFRFWTEDIGDDLIDEATAIPDITSATYTDATKVLDLTIVEASGAATVYWALVTNPSTPTKNQVRGGSGGGILEAGSFTISTGSNTDTIVVTNTAGNEIHLFAENADDDRSDPITVITGVVVT